MRAIITVGLGFGDEGKGATVDALTRQLRAEVVVRYCGGAQAGHNVQLEDGRRHTFSQFGAGTLAGARTHLGPRVIIHPSTMVPEAEHLKQLGIDDPWALLTAHPDCLVSTYFHVLMNRLRESARGDSRHGSCGLGIGEARHYWLRYGQDAIVARDLRDSHTLVQKLCLLRERFLIEMQELRLLDKRLAAALHDALPRGETDALSRASAQLELSDRIPSCDTAIFEGAQGMLLDEWKGFHPFTTWSTVTPQHALEMLAEHNCRDVTVLGLTRAVTTRHGTGPLPTWCPKLSAGYRDAGNPENPWQGAMRVGPLDLVLTEYAARFCSLDGIVVNCLDQLGPQPRICRQYVGLDRLDTPHSLAEQEQLTRQLESARPVISDTTVDGIIDALGEIAPVMGTSRGPTWLDREFASSLGLGRGPGFHPGSWKPSSLVTS